MSDIIISISTCIYIYIYIYIYLRYTKPSYGVTMTQNDPKLGK